jgi:hypothetical protein
MSSPAESEAINEVEFVLTLKIQRKLSNIYTPDGAIE